MPSPHRLVSLHEMWLNIWSHTGTFCKFIIAAITHMPSCGHMDGTPELLAEDGCPGGDQGPYEFFVYKYPRELWFEDVFWLNHHGNGGDHDPGNHRVISDDTFEEWKGSFVGIFRDPLARMVSAFKHFGAGLEASEIPRFAQHTKGTITKLLAGSDPELPLLCSFEYKDDCSTGKSEPMCESCLESASEDLPVALERLKGFAFIGLTEHFELSVCLFHAMFGGTCFPVESMNMRPGVETYDSDELLSELDGFEDIHDNAVYAAASNRFWSDIETFKVNNATCAKLCPGVDAFSA